MRELRPPPHAGAYRLQELARRRLPVVRLYCFAKSTGWATFRTWPTLMED